MMYELEFEKPLIEIEEKIQALQQAAHTVAHDFQLEALKEELQSATRNIYNNLTAWQTVQVARHKNRPYTMDYIQLMCDDFFELCGDRCFGDDRAIIGGIAKLDDTTIMVIGHQKGRNTKEKQLHNFGMPHPEGYRKAQRLMRLSEKFAFPLLCLIDTPGAFPGLQDEERGQAEAIAVALYTMSRLRIPTIAVVIGEGGSGGALAIGVADCLLMLEHSIYTVASPEAAASILWRDTTFAPQAANSMQINAPKLKAMHLIDDLISEPLGGAHQDHRQAAKKLKSAVLNSLRELQALSCTELLEKRYQKYRFIGTSGIDL